MLIMISGLGIGGGLLVPSVKQSQSWAGFCLSELLMLHMLMLLYALTLSSLCPPTLFSLFCLMPF